MWDETSARALRAALEKAADDLDRIESERRTSLERVLRRQVSMVALILEDEIAARRWR